MASGATAIAYETVTDAQGGLPLLAPMSEVAGRMAVQVGARCLEKEQGGARHPAGRRARGAAGAGGDHRRRRGRPNAARIAMGMRARVTVLDQSPRVLNALDVQFNGRVDTLFATRDAIEHAVLEADLVIGAVLVPGAAAPRLVTRDMVRADAARHR